MQTRFHFDDARQPAWSRRLMVVAWVLIAAKCLLVGWAIERWQVPVHGAWIIGPTLAMAVCVTWLWATHREE